MKKLLVLAVLMSSSVMAGERVVTKEKKTFDVVINNDTVRCDDRGYGITELRVYIEELNTWTTYDHSKIDGAHRGGRQELPRLIAGTCTGYIGQGYETDDIIQGNSRREKVVVTRKLVESRYIANTDSSLCLRTFRETITATINGIKFEHGYSTFQDHLPASSCGAF